VYLAEDSDAFTMLAAIGKCVAIFVDDPESEFENGEVELLGMPAPP
jgi:hypothetical protein